MRIVASILLTAICIALLFNLSPLSVETLFIALIILIGSIGIMERLDDIYKHEQKILKELRCKQKDDDE